MSTTQKTGIAFVALVAAALVFATSFAFAQVEADLEAELNSISSQIDTGTAMDINVDALGTQADVSAQAGITTDVQTEYANLFGDDVMMDDSMMEDDVLHMEADAGAQAGGISAFFSAVFTFLFGWLY